MPVNTRPATTVDLPDRLGTAAAHATTQVPVAAPADPVDLVLPALRGRSFDSVAVVAVCVDGRLVGLAPLEQVLAAPSGAVLADIMDPDPPAVGPHTDQERAAWEALHRGESGLAVVGEDGRFGGIIPPDRLLGILLEEHDEDLVRLGGFLRGAESARSASVESVPRRLWHRLPWLAVGLVGAMVSAGMMAAFEAQLAANLLVAFFVPGIVYLADAVGTQTEAIAIRGLSVGVGIRRVLGRELLTGLLVGVALGALMFPSISLLWGDVVVAAAVATAVVTASAIATVVALALPWALHRLGRDPAFGSGPLATVVQDLLSILLYFAIVVVMLS
jgi:magnesium transporter